MPTIGQTNLSAPATQPGKLSGAELARQRWEQRVGFVPEGCDSQGRVEAAHAASEFDDDPPISRITWAQLRAFFNPAGIALMLAFAATVALFGWGSVELIKAALAGLP